MQECFCILFSNASAYWKAVILLAQSCSIASDASSCSKLLVFGLPVWYTASTRV